MAFVWCVAIVAVTAMAGLVFARLAQFARVELGRIIRAEVARALVRAAQTFDRKSKEITALSARVLRVEREAGIDGQWHERGHTKIIVPGTRTSSTAITKPDARAGGRE